MPRLTPISYTKFCKFLEYIGCEFKRQKGSHLIYVRDDLPRSIVVPAKKNLSQTVIQSNLKTLGIDRDKYLRILSEIT